MVKDESIKLKALSDIASIDTNLGFNEILQKILMITCEAINANSGSLMLIDEIDNELKIVSSYGLPENDPGSIISAAKQAMDELISSPSNHIIHHGKTTQLFIPMKRGMKIFGILNIHVNKIYAISEEEINFIITAAYQASSFVQNKNSNNILMESQEKFRKIFENAQDPMYTHDLNGIFTDINKAGLEQLGCKEDEVIGSHISKWLTPQSNKLVEERFRQIYFGKTLDQPVIIEVICGNGEHKWAEVRTSLIRQGNRIVGTHGIARDITEKIKLEQKIKDYRDKLERSYEELVEADRIKNEFMSNITHELFTPLTSIRGFAELLYDETMGSINIEQKKSLGTILRNSDRLIHLIKELLDASNYENNKFGLKFNTVSMNLLLSKAIQDTYPQANEKQISIIRDIAPLPEIWGDEERLVQVIMNLLVNAIKFTPSEGKIIIKASEDIEELRISISDTGIGIPPDKLDIIFERFYQVDGSTSRKYGGAGLGLSICKNIIDKHFGSIWAESSDKGSTFHIVLPKLKPKNRKQDVN